MILLRLRVVSNTALSIPAEECEFNRCGSRADQSGDQTWDSYSVRESTLAAAAP
jgi:hypothetical protein